MIIVHHRVNSVDHLNRVPPDEGIEVDIRSWGSALVMHHDAFVGGPDFVEFIHQYRHRLLIANVKEEGIERRVIESIESAGIRDYFLLDVTFPFLVRYASMGFRNLAVRFSEYEDMQTCLNLAGKVNWVFVDNFTRLPVEGGAFGRLAQHFRLCVVSPELLHRDEIPFARDVLATNPATAVLTDHPEAWR